VFQPEYEVVVENVCPTDFVSEGHVLADDAIAIICRPGSGSSLPPLIYRFDELSRTAELVYTGPPEGLRVLAFVGNVMYISLGTARSPTGDYEMPGLQALRLDAGAVTPSTVVKSTSNGISQFAVSQSYAYWTYVVRQPESDTYTESLSRAPLSGGAEEVIGVLPVRPTQLSLFGDDAYVLGHSSDSINYNISLAHVSIPDREAQVIFSEPKGDGDESKMWLGVYQDRVIFADSTGTPAKLYEIRGATPQLAAPATCIPSLNSVVAGDVVASHDKANCISPFDSAPIAINLNTGEIEYSQLGSGYTVIGWREGWIYIDGFRGIGNTARVRTKPFVK
jgi:hypothetical protein